MACPRTLFAQLRHILSGSPNALIAIPFEPHNASAGQVILLPLIRSNLSCFASTDDALYSSQAALTF